MSLRGQSCHAMRAPNAHTLPKCGPVIENEERISWQEIGRLQANLGGKASHDSRSHGPVCSRSPPRVGGNPPPQDSPTFFQSLRRCRRERAARKPPSHPYRGRNTGLPATLRTRKKRPVQGAEIAERRITDATPRKSRGPPVGNARDARAVLLGPRRCAHEVSERSSKRPLGKRPARRRAVHAVSRPGRARR